MSYHESTRKTFAAGAAIAHQSVVKLGAVGVEACGADDTPLGFVEIGAREAGELVSVRLKCAPGAASPPGRWSARARAVPWSLRAARLLRSAWRWRPPPMRNLSKSFPSLTVPLPQQPAHKEVVRYAQNQCHYPSRPRDAGL